MMNMLLKKIRQLGRWINPYAFLSLIIGILLITIFLSIVVALPRINNNLKFSESEKIQRDLSNKMNTMKNVNAYSSEFNRLYQDYLQTDLNSTLNAKKNLIISSDGSKKTVDTTYQGIDWNYTTINENNSYFYNLWEDADLAKIYIVSRTTNSFGYVATSSLTKGLRCYYDVSITNPYCERSFNPTLTYEIRDATTTYPTDWTMNDILKQTKAKTHIIFNSIHNEIFSDSNNQYPYVFLWGDEEPYTKKYSRISSGNHLTYYLRDKLTDITLSFKAKFYGHLLIKPDDDQPFQKVAQSNGELIDVNINVPSLVAIRLIAPPHLDRERGKLYDSITKRNNLIESPLETFKKEDDFNKIFLYHLSLLQNNTVMKPWKLNATAIAFNRLLLDEKDMDYGVKSGLYQYLKDIYFNILQEVGTPGYDLNFMPNKKRSYEQAWFELFKDGNLNQANRFYFEFFSFGHHVSNNNANLFNVQPTLPLKKPFGWMKNNFFITAKLNKNQDYNTNLLLIRKLLYSSDEYDIYQNPPVVNYELLKVMTSNFVLNRFLGSEALQFQSHFVSFLLSKYDTEISQNQEMLSTYQAIGNILGKLFYGALTSDHFFQESAFTDNLYFESYYKNSLRKEVFNQYDNFDLGTLLIKTIKKNQIRESKILKTIRIQNPNGSEKKVYTGWRAGEKTDFKIKNPDQWLNDIKDILSNYSTIDLEQILTTTFRGSKNENFIQFLNLAILTGNQNLFKTNEIDNNAIQMLQNIADVATYFGKPTRTVWINSKYVRKPNTGIYKYEKQTGLWEIGKIFDVNQPNSKYQNVINNYIKSKSDGYIHQSMIKWTSNSNNNIMDYLPVKYKQDNDLSKEVQKAYQFMSDKISSEMRNMTLTLGFRSIPLSFVKSIISSMKDQQFIGGQRTSFQFSINHPFYKVIQFHDPIKITTCSTNEFQELIVPADNEWCGITNNQVDYTMQAFIDSDGSDYMSLVNTDDFMKALSHAFFQFKTSSTTDEWFSDLIKTLITYLWYLSF